MKIFLHSYNNGLSSWKETNANGVMLYQLYSEYKTAQGNYAQELIATFPELEQLENFIRDYINNDIQKIKD